MPSIERPLHGPVMLLDLETERTSPASAAGDAASGRSARTLVKDGPLRLTMIVVAPGGEIGEHRAAGPILVQPIEGEIDFIAAGETHRVRAGQLLAVEAGVTHSVRSENGGTFLLTVTQPNG